MSAHDCKHKKWILTCCPHCGRVKKYGRWVKISSAQQQEICKRVDEIKPILEICPSCRKKLERREL